MDDVKRSTLKLMTDVAIRLGIEEAGRHLILIAHDFAAGSELARSRDVLCMVTDFYYDHFLVVHTAADEDFRLAVAALVEWFGVVDFRILRKTGITA